MKLLNRSLLYLSLTFLIIIGSWSVVFYLNLKDEIRDSIDDGLDNNRLLILQKVKTDSTLLLQNEYGGNNFEIHATSKRTAFTFKDVYKDTLMYRQNERDLEPVRILESAFEHQNKYYKLKIISSLIEEDDLIEDSLWSVSWLFFILITSIIIINNVVFRKIWQPFYDILAQLKTYRLDRAAPPITSITDIKEFIQLQNASNALISHSKEAYTSQKQFTENASHELQTPIAIIINKLELLLESVHLKEKDAKTIAEVINISNRLKKLNNSLLLLAKIENEQFLKQDKFFVNEISQELIADVKEFAEFKKINIEVVETAFCQVKMNISLAEMLISNLIKNAIFHNKLSGNITVQISENEFTICNSGTTTPLDDNSIFNRFEKKSLDNKGTGLGLAICKAICKSSGIGLSYNFKGDEHCFTLNLTNVIAPVQIPDSF